MGPGVRPETAGPVEQALIDFERAPHRFRVALGEPAVVFASMVEVLQLAIGRQAHGTLGPVQKAARFFVRTALLHAQADPYALLGLKPGARDEEVKKHYRLLMRLLHPDFACDSHEWGVDAAVRVNLAYETLSSPQRRRAYDERKPAAPQVRRPTAPQPAPPPTKRAARKRGIDFRGTRAKLAIVASLGIAMALMAVLILSGQAPADAIVQRLPAEKAVPPAELAHDEPPATLLPAFFTEARAQTTAAALPSAARYEPREQAGPAVATGAEPAAQVQPAALQLPPQSAPAQVSAIPNTDAPPASPEPAQPAQIVAAALPSPAVQPEAVTAADAHALLSRLFQQLESGQAEGVLSVVDPTARGTTEAQALMRDYREITQGLRPRVGTVQLKGDAQGRMLRVHGSVRLQVGELSKDLRLQAEFARRNGVIVMTRLAPGA